MSDLIGAPGIVGLIVLLPFLAFLLCIGIGSRPRIKPHAHWIAWILVGLSTLLCLVHAQHAWHLEPGNGSHGEGLSGVWISLAAGNSVLSIGYNIDQLTAVMLVVVGFVGWLIHIYSSGYMKGDVRYHWFFAYLSLFMASMLLLVLSDNLVGLFIGWELVGLCSYLLVGFWFERQSAAVACKKAFLVTRIGDAFFAVGIFLIFFFTGQLGFDGVFHAVKNDPAHGALFLVAALLLFGGAIGKSAQFPLHVWLPDAMEGPTPVSALIHAATMVTAGVYLVARMFPLFALPVVPGIDPLTVVTWIGALTAFGAATIALTQFDIKRVLAYSTISQLGYMMLALGIGGYSAATYHLMTHGFFKALLFLGAGSVIHAMHGAADPNDMRLMGGLKSRMPITFWTYLIGVLALSGIFPFAGFWSKDEILLHAFHADKMLWVIGTLTAFLTALYMGRQVFLVFFGRPRWGGTLIGSQHVGDHHVDPHESPPVMWLPLVILAFFSCTIGWLFLKPGTYHHVTSHVIEGFVALPAVHHSVVVLCVSIGAAVLGLFVAWILYGRAPVTAVDGDPLPGMLSRPAVWIPFWEKDVTPWSFLSNKWHLDWYEWLASRWAVFATMRGCVLFDVGVVDRTVDAIGYSIARVLAQGHRLFDTMVVDGLVNLVGFSTKLGGRLCRRFQTGLVQHYMFFVVIGLAFIIIWGISR